MTDEARLTMAQTYARIFDTPDGQLVLEDMRRSYDGSCFDANPTVMAWKTGRREPYLDIRAILAYARDPQAYALTVVSDQDAA